MKCNFLTLIVFILTAFVYTSAAQSLLTGKVRDAITNEPLTGVNIIAKEQQLGTISDTDGNYKLQLPEGTHSIMFSFIGYESLTKEILAISQSIQLSVSLTESDIFIGEVRVTAKLG